MLIIKAEGLPGESIPDCLAEACRLAQMLNCYIEFSANKRTAVVGRSGRSDEAWADWHRQAQEPR